MPNLSEEEKRILAGLEKAQAEREAIPLEERIPITHPDKYAFPIGLPDGGGAGPDTGEEPRLCLGEPRHFLLAARYRPGYQAGQGWELTITGTGRATRKTDREPASTAAMPNDPAPSPSRYEFRLDDRALAELWRTIDAARFFTLKESYAAPVTCGDTLVLEITDARRTWRVKVYAPGHITGEARITDFMSVWSKALELDAQTDKSGA